MIEHQSLDIGGAAPGSRIAVRDLFGSEAQFHGLTFGTIRKSQCYRWSFEFTAKLSVGNTRSDIVILGQTSTTDVDGGSSTDDQGLLARSTNRGTYGIDEFSVLPELGLTLEYELTPQARCRFGYRALYWSQLARAADQIDLDVNLSNPLTGLERPEFPLDFSDFWAQGLTIGIDYRF